MFSYYLAALVGSLEARLWNAKIYAARKFTSDVIKGVFTSSAEIFQTGSEMLDVDL